MIAIRFQFKHYKGKEREWESFHRVVADVLYCNVRVSEFELQSRYYIHFRTINFGKDLKPLIAGAIGNQGWLWHWITHENWYAMAFKEENVINP